MSNWARWMASSTAFCTAASWPPRDTFKKRPTSVASSFWELVTRVGDNDKMEIPRSWRLLQLELEPSNRSDQLRPSLMTKATITKIYESMSSAHTQFCCWNPFLNGPRKWNHLPPKNRFAIASTSAPCSIFSQEASHAHRSGSGSSNSSYATNQDLGCSWMIS